MALSLQVFFLEQSPAFFTFRTLTYKSILATCLMECPPFCICLVISSRLDSGAGVWMQDCLTLGEGLGAGDQPP